MRTYLLPSVEPSHGGQEIDDSAANMGVADRLHFNLKEVGAMRILTNIHNRWIRRTTATGLVLLVLVQVFIGLHCVPQTLRAGEEIRREMTWEELRGFLIGKEKVTILLSEGGAIRGDTITVLADSIHLGRIIRATDTKEYPTGSEAVIAIGSVQEIRVEEIRGSDRIASPFFFGAGALGLARLMLLLKTHFSTSTVRDEGRAATIFWSTLVCAPAAGAVLGYWVGKNSDREITIIMLVD